MPRSIIIIGAGMAGLSAGCYAEMNGFETQLFEQHTTPGGVCTSWKRKGYTFDCCIHNLGGSSEHTRPHEVWRELGAVPARSMISYDEFVQVEEDAHTFTVYTDIDRLEKHMEERFPDDEHAIKEFTSAARHFTDFELLSAGPLARKGELLRALKFIPALIKWSRLSLKQYAARFTDPFLQRAFPCVMYDVEDIPMIFLLNFLAQMHKGDLGYPTGGSLAFSQAIADRYHELGGTIHYKSRVTKILVEDDRAVGVALADGTTHRAGVVVSDADGRTTIFDMLEGKYANERIRAFYAHPQERQAMTVHVSFGVQRDVSNEPHAIVLFLEEPVQLMDTEVDRLDLELSSHDPTLAPSGKGTIKAVLNSSYQYWRRLHATHEVYQAEKERLAEIVADQLETRFPGLKEQIEVVDVATPITFERYTGTWQGFQAWQPDQSVRGVVNTFIGRAWCRTLPGLKDFYMVGQWAGDFGLYGTAVGGRKLVQHFCKLEGKRFKTSST